MCGGVPGGPLLGDCLGISWLVVVAFASLVFVLFSFFSLLPIKPSLTQPMNFLTVALLILSAIPLWGAVSEQL